MTFEETEEALGRLVRSRVSVRIVERTELMNSSSFRSIPASASTRDIGVPRQA
jgi:hypothetical protein